MIRPDGVKPHKETRRVYHSPMNTKAFWAAVLIVASVLTEAEAATLTGRVIVIHDGATITVLDATRTQHIIRLAGIDAPEIKQAFGSGSKQNLLDLLDNKSVKVEWDKRDQFKRIVGKVRFTPDVCVTAACLEGSDASYEQIAAGCAWHDKQYASAQSPEDRERYAAAENAARAALRGLWADVNPVPPWEFRKQRRNAR